MGTELYRFVTGTIVEKNNLFGLQSLSQIFLQIESLHEREQYKGGTKEVLV